MDDGMFDDVPLMNKARDKAWDAGFKSGYEAKEKE